MLSDAWIVQISRRCAPSDVRLLKTPLHLPEPILHPSPRPALSSLPPPSLLSAYACRLVTKQPSETEETSLSEIFWAPFSEELLGSAEKP